ncbi:MAG: hypothetical protein KIT09_10820 [Bryobacteraceae bacterium]|nr:hypothetical protein [Bryobacteraceae bacterium]
MSRRNKPGRGGLQVSAGGMYIPMRTTILLTCMTLVSAVGPAWAGDAAQLRRSFLDPPDDARIMMRWWWFGPSVVKAELEREMRQMKAAGIGGFEIQPVYPLALDDEQAGIRNLAFLSGEFLEALRFTAEKASELGLRMDLTLGTGWPYGGPDVPVSQAAARLRVERAPVNSHTRRVPLPAIGQGEQLLGTFHIETNSGAIAAEEVAGGGSDGALWFGDGAHKPEEVWFFIASRTGQMVKRAAVGGEGFVIDHYSRGATERYLRTVANPMIEALRSRIPFAVFCDSLEAFGADWTPDFLDEFQRRRGYDLKPRLAALTGDNPGFEARAIRHDWGRTLTELLNERFLAPMKEWSVRNGTRFRIQNYGTPPAVMASHAYVDLPEGEGSQWKTLRQSRWAASASHIYRRPVASSETWTWLHSPSFRATPLDLKAEADRHFLQGINELNGHGWPYSPPGAEYPGWRFYAAAALNENNPWWIVMPDVARYLQRLSFLLRQGRPANDVALYLPNGDAWASFRLGKVHMIEALRERVGDRVIAAVLEAGYNLDFIDDGSLEQTGRIEQGALSMGDGRYRVVILPGVECMPPATLRTLDRFARSGGALIATRRLPDCAPGFRATAAEHSDVRRAVRSLFEGERAPARFVADEDRELARTLRGALKPDLALSPAAPEIGFIRRTTQDAEIYFVANTGNQARNVKATFRIGGKEPQLWDPLTGEASPADVRAREEDATTIAMDLPPYGSRVVVFSSLPAPAADGEGRAAPPPPIDLSRGWQVTFGERSVFMDALRSWTDDEETRYYSGTATYEKRVAVPAAFLRASREVELDLGEGRTADPAAGDAQGEGMKAFFEGPVREAAVVYVNEERAGAVWCPPYAVDVRRLLRPGENRIRIVVANLAVNHMASRALPDYRLLHLRYGERFTPQDMGGIQAIPSGLSGPIRLIGR